MKRSTKIFGAAAIAVLAALVLWYPVAEPMLVRFPKSTRVTTHYTGTLTTYMDNATGGRLASPSTIPLSIDRVVQSVPGHTGATRAVVSETNTIHAGGLDQWQRHIYVLDRRTMQNVKDPRNAAYGEPTDPAGTYRVTLPMGTKHSGAYAIFSPETGSSYEMHAASGPATTTVDGLRVLRMTGSERPTPVGPQYSKVMVPFMQLPTSLTFAQVTAQLQAAGIDVNQLMSSLTPTLSASELQSLTATLLKPVPLRYFAFVDGGDALIEPDTGMIVGLPSVNDGVSVAPDLSVWAPALQILGQHAGVPAVQAALATITTLAAAPPTPVYRLQYQETPASMVSSAHRASTERSKLRLARTYAPAGLLVLASILGALALVTWRRSGPETPADIVRYEPPRTASKAA